MASQKEEDECILIMESKNELLLPTTGNGVPTWKNAHFLKPLINPANQALPELPSLSLSSNPDIFGLTNGVHFRGRPRPLKTWKTWVENLQQTHQNSWIKLGIFDAIMASTYQIKRHNELIIGLAEKWCPETNTFIFPWGESTITLEDIMVLGGFSVLGVSVLSPFQKSWEFGDYETKLADTCYELRRESHNASHYGWMNRFRGKGGELEHLALLVLWLSRYVFSTNSYNLINPNVFNIAISLVKGVKVALAPAVLASIYRDLSLFKGKIVSFISEPNDHVFDLVLWAPFQIVQLWFWERFPMLSPNPASLMLGEPRLARWHNINKLQVGFLMEQIESAGNTFLWRPYASPLKNWEFPKSYSDNARWVWINPQVDEEQELLSFARCLRACELVGMDCIEQYLPHRVGMQFGMDQDIPDSLPKSNSNSNRAWISYDVPLDGWKLYLPPRASNGEVTVRYYNWWKEAISACHDDPMIIEKLSRVSNGNVGVGEKIPPPSPTYPSHEDSKTQMGESPSCTKGLPLMGVKGFIGKGEHIALREDHRETQEGDQNTFRSSNIKCHSQLRSLMVGKEAGEAPPDNLVIIEDDDDDHSNGNNDHVSQFLALISGIEARISGLEGDVVVLKCC